MCISIKLFATFESFQKLWICFEKFGNSFEKFGKSFEKSVVKVYICKIGIQTQLSPPIKVRAKLILFCFEKFGKLFEKFGKRFEKFGKSFEKFGKILKKIL